jgi:hypothetical protein
MNPLSNQNNPMELLKNMNLTNPGGKIFLISNLFK